MSRTSVCRGLRGGALILMLAVLAGCGGSKKTGTVKGKVTINGKPVTGGAVTFYGAEGRLDSGAIGRDGEYTLARAPVGEVTATVLPSQPRATRTPTGGPRQKDKSTAHPGAASESDPDPDPDVKPVPVPRKYHTKEGSGLKYTVDPGEQTINIELK